MDDCSICLSDIVNRTELDSCNHTFCFLCIKTWSRINSTCPLCKGQFTTLKYDIRSDKVYRVYEIFKEQEQVYDDAGPVAPSQTLFTQRHLERQARDNPFIDWIENERRIAIQLLKARERIYNSNLWATDLTDATGSPVGVRDVSPSFLSQNEACCHRLQIWLSREIKAILGDSCHAHVPRLINSILSNCKRHFIMSDQFCNKIRYIFGNKTKHFAHEFYKFASSPFEMEEYDRNVKYEPQVLSEDESDVEIISIQTSNSDSVIELSDDEDIEILSASTAPIESLPNEIDVINYSDNENQELHHSRNRGAMFSVHMENENQQLFNSGHRSAVTSMHVENNITRKRKYSKTIPSKIILSKHYKLRIISRQPAHEASQ